MTDLVQLGATKNSKKKALPQIETGDTVGVSVRVKEGEKERVQLFKGVVLKVQGQGASRSFTVRKISEGIGVERTFPFNCPSVDGVEVFAYGKRVRKSRMYFLRDRQGRAAKVKSDLAGSREEKAAPQTATTEAATTAPAEAAPKKKSTKK